MQVGKCPGPDEDRESVYVHYSCDGGVTWHLLHTLPAAHHKEPRHVNSSLSTYTVYRKEFVHFISSVSSAVD